VLVLEVLSVERLAGCFRWAVFVVSLPVVNVTGDVMQQVEANRSQEVQRQLLQQHGRRDCGICVCQATSFPFLPE